MSRNSSTNHQPSYRAGKTVTPGVRVNLWNVHLQSGDATETRCQQVAEVVEWVREAHDGQVADLVAGDFNCAPGSEPDRQLVNCIGPGALELSHESPFMTYNGSNPDRSGARALAHLFVRLHQPAQTVQAQPEVAFTAGEPPDCLSDHYGVMVRLDLIPAGSMVQALRPIPLALRDQPVTEGLAEIMVSTAD